MDRVTAERGRTYAAYLMLPSPPPLAGLQSGHSQDHSTTNLIEEIIIHNYLASFPLQTFKATWVCLLRLCRKMYFFLLKPTHTQQSGVYRNPTHEWKLLQPINCCKSRAYSSTILWNRSDPLNEEKNSRLKDEGAIHNSYRRSSHYDCKFLAFRA